MRRLLSPASIAVVGVSTREGSFGRRTWENLSGFRGARFPVNPGYEGYDGQVCYRSLADLPSVPDCVVICTAGNQVEAVVRECAQMGVGGVVIYASGYAETGNAECKLEQDQLARIAQSAGLLLLGPNCMGFIETGSGAAVTFAPPLRLQPLNLHAIALVSQSGAIGFAQLQAGEHGTTFSHMLTSGNSCDVDIADQIGVIVLFVQIGALSAKKPNHDRHLKLSSAQRASKFASH